jgi:hypothetical protein
MEDANCNPDGNPCAKNPDKKLSSLSGGAIAAIVFATLFAFCFLIVILFFCAFLYFCYLVKGGEGVCSRCSFWRYWSCRNRASTSYPQQSIRPPNEEKLAADSYFTYTVDNLAT